MKSSIEKGRNSKNNLPNNKLTEKIFGVKPPERKSFMDKAKKPDKNKNTNFKKDNSSNKFIQVNTKRKNVLTKNYDLNKIVLIQKYFKALLAKKQMIKNKYKSIIIFIRKIIKIFLSKNFVLLKQKLGKSNKKKNKKTTKKKLLSINTNIYNTNKISVNNTEHSKKEKVTLFCRTTKHNKIMNYVDYKLGLNQANNLTNASNNIFNIKKSYAFSPKMNSVTDRPDIPFNKIRYKNSLKKVRNKNPKSGKILEQFKSKTLMNNDFSNEMTVNNNLTEKNITVNSIIDNKGNDSKCNNFKSNISKIHRKGLSYNFDYPDSNLKEIQYISKDINPLISIIKNKKAKNDESHPIKTEMNKIKKIKTLFNNKTSKNLNSKNYENCHHKDTKDKNINKKGTKVLKTLLNQKKQKTKKEFNTKKNPKTNKLNVNINENNKPQILNKTNLIKRYFEFWKESTEKKNVLIKFVKFSKYLNHMNHYEKIILIKNTIQQLIKFQKKESIFDFFWRMKRQILIDLMKKLKEFKKINDDIKKIDLNSFEEGIFSNKIKKLKIMFNLLENHKKNFNNNNSQVSDSLNVCFEKWKNILKFPKINEKVIDLKTFQAKSGNTNLPINAKSDDISLKKNLSLSKISPKIINVINVQNYNENNNYNYNFKCDPIKDIQDIPLYPIKPRNSYAYTKEHLNLNNNSNNNNKVYHKKKLGNTYINNNYNFNINNNSETMMNCFNKKLNNEDKQKIKAYDTSSLLIPVQNNNSEIISLEKNNIFYNSEHPEEKFGFKKLGQIEEKEINFLENTNINNISKGNNINKLYIRKQNLDKKNICFKKKTNVIKAVKNTIKSLNIQFDNTNEGIIKKEKNNIFDYKLRLNKMFSSKNLFTEFNYYQNKNDEDKNNKSFNADINTAFNDDFRISDTNFNNNSPF